MCNGILTAQMQKRLTHLKDEFAQIRGGSVNKDMLNSVVVSAYGSRVPLTEAGQITLKNTNSLAVAAFDAGMIPFIVTALRDSDLNISPVVEGGTVVVNVPKPSKEARELQVKMVGKISEKVGRYCRYSVPNNNDS
jgi:ribosome recycling factor